ncbi:hypothetical protein BLA29_003299, partial [Euroglyphus maynei]
EFDAHAKCGDRFCDLNLECDQKCSYNETTGRHKCRCFNNRYELDSDNKCQIRQHFSKKLEKCLPENDQTLKVFEMPYIDEFDNCRCKFGYKYDKTNKKCKENGMEFQIDSDYYFRFYIFIITTTTDEDRFHKELGCEKFRFNDDGKSYECECPNGQHFDQQYGKCRWNPCPAPNMIKFAHNENDVGDFECISPCDSKLVRSCSGGPFFSCQPELAIESLKKHNPEWEIEKPFIHDKQKKITDFLDYCQCIFGLDFDADERICKPSSQYQYYTIDMNFKKINSKIIVCI